MKKISKLNIGEEIIVKTKQENFSGVFCEVEDNYLKAIGKGGLIYCIPLMLIQNVITVGAV